MRCFIAAWPEARARVALARLSDDVRQRIAHRRATRADDLHLTLAFIGDLNDDAAFDLADAIATLRFEPIDWQIDTLGFFAQAGVVWAGGDRIRPLADLADHVRAWLAGMHIVYDQRPLAPHVTLLRGARNFATEKISPIEWRIESVALYRSAASELASRYSRVAR